MEWVITNFYFFGVEMVDNFWKMGYGICQGHNISFGDSGNSSLLPVRSVRILFLFHFVF